ncbi:MAG: hypothetical protein ILP19_06325, partial [Oscillospiraceae bacterium]|nr:hypothetical protein [Oscillospiraceae bacterium]
IIPAEYNGHRITKIAQRALYSKDIKTAELCGITYIDNQAFLGCASLEKAICTGELYYMGGSAFADTGLDDLIITGNNTMNVLSAGTLPADTNVYVMGSSPAETAFVNYYTRTLNTDTSTLNILSFVWNGDECTLNVTNHASGDTTEISADVTSQNGRYTAEAEFMGAVLTDEKAIPVEVVTEMQMTADSSKVMLDLYITLPENSEGLTVTVDGDEVKPENGVCTADIRAAAKDMGKKHTITVTQDGETVFEKTVSAADYLKALLEDESYSELHPTVKAMLCYFAAAQNYFGTGETDGFVNEGTEGAGFDTLGGVTIAHTAPEKADIDAALARAGLDVYMEYNSMNMSFTADTSLLIAFRLNDPAKADEAMEALGDKVYGTGIEIYTDGTGKFIILKVPNIPIKKLGDTAVTIGDLDIAGTALLDKVINGNYSEKTTLLCKGLYAYYLAAE